MMSIALKPVPRPAFWRWALVVLFATGVVAGLLGMHTLSAGHAEAPITSLSTDAQAHGHEQSSIGTSGDVSECADCGTSGHDALMMICILGLLATLLTIARPAHVVLSAHIPRMTIRHTPGAGVLLAHPPSLHELSISRT